ncbi:hypothetical protein P692DRAFT_20822420 [Suillus brevipes Sb2]|nr:hypothetical protein P692DRAFT_20822420 [Suillus brevipes Sb2]
MNKTTNPAQNHPTQTTKNHKTRTSDTQPDSLAQDQERKRANNQPQTPNTPAQNNTNKNQIPTDQQNVPAPKKILKKQTNHHQNCNKRQLNLQHKDPADRQNKQDPRDKDQRQKQIHDNKGQIDETNHCAAITQNNDNKNDLETPETKSPATDTLPNTRTRAKTTPPNHLQNHKTESNHSSKTSIKTNQKARKPKRNTENTGKKTSAQTKKPKLRKTSWGPACETWQIQAKKGGRHQQETP